MSGASAGAACDHDREYLNQRGGSQDQLYLHCYHAEETDYKRYKADQLEEM